MRIQYKINQIKEMLTELEKIKPKSYEEYLEIKTKAACERYFEKITEAQVDFAILILKNLRLKLPEDDKSSYDILAN